MVKSYHHRPFTESEQKRLIQVTTGKVGGWQRVHSNQTGESSKQSPEMSRKSRKM